MLEAKYNTQPLVLSRKNTVRFEINRAVPAQNPRAGKEL